MLELTPERKGLLTEVVDVISTNAAGGSALTVTLETLRQSDFGPAVSGRPEEWEPRVVLAAAEDGFSVRSVDHFKWGHPRTGRRFDLPRIPFDMDCSLMTHPLFRGRAEEFGWRWMPAERLFINAASEGILDVRTSAAHNQFDYARVMKKQTVFVRNGHGYWASSCPVTVSRGEGVLSVAGMDKKRILNEVQADDLERQVFEGTIAMVRKLIDKCVADPQSWSDAMDANSELVAAREEQAFARSQYPVDPWFNV